MSLSAVAYLEKNKLASTGVWIVLLKIQTPKGIIIRICANTEDVIWPVTGGDTYIAFPFELDEIGESSKGEIPQLTIRVSNVSRVMQSYMEAEDGMVNSEVIIRVVHSTHITTASKGVGIHNLNPEAIAYYDIIDSNVDNQWASFILGASSPFRMRFPRNRVLRNFCRYKVFKGAQCKYVGVQTTCDRTLYTCRNTMKNSNNFGGAPGIGSGGTYV